MFALQEQEEQQLAQTCSSGFFPVSQAKEFEVCSLRGEVGFLLTSDSRLQIPYSLLQIDFCLLTFGLAQD